MFTRNSFEDVILNEQDSMDTDSTGKKINKVIRRHFMASFVVAVLLSSILLGLAMYLIIDNHIHHHDDRNDWAYSIITLLLGVWVTDRPTTLTKKSKE